MLRDAEAEPAAVAVKETVSVQVPPAARVAAQVEVWVKKAALAPESEMPERVTASDPVFVRVTVWAALVAPMACEAKVSDAGLSESEGPVPDPLRAMVCGEEDALSAMVMEADAAPAEVGAKVTAMTQVAAGASDEEQVEVSLNCEDALSEMLEKVRAAFPVLLRVMDCAALEVPTA